MIERFGGMLNAFRYGAPPHAGMAPGIDRIVMLLAGAQNIREVIAFPLNQQAQDLMMGAPSRRRQATARAASQSERARTEMSLSAGATARPLRVLNVMLGVRSGGLERSIVSFHEALSAGGAEVTSALSPGAWARGLFGPDRRIVEVATSERLAWRARRQMASALKGQAFDVVLAHGNRAVKAAVGLSEAPLVAVAHTTNLNLAKFGHRLDGVILPVWAPPRTLADLRPSSLAEQHLELFRAARDRGRSDRLPAARLARRRLEPAARRQLAPGDRRARAH